MNVKKILAAGVLVSTMLVGSGVAAGAATTTNDTAWPAWADGRPALDPGVRLWHDANGWHVRVTHSSLHDRTFAGVVHTTGALVDVQAVRLEPNDTLKVSSDKHSIAFRFNNYGGIDGFDWKTQNAPALAFGLMSNGKVLAPHFVSIGHASTHPATDPFRIVR
jgi:hypothetical protein